MARSHEDTIFRAALDGDTDTVERMVADLKPHDRQALRLAVEMIASSALDLDERTRRG